jgi:hypothetical protein
MEAFTHVLGRYAKQAADDRTIIACLVAWGTNMGLGRMGDISDVGYQALATTSENFMRLETLREANDLVSNATSELPIFRHYDIGALSIPAVTVRSLRPASTPSMPAIRPSISGSKKGGLLLPCGQSCPHQCENHWGERP